MDRVYVVVERYDESADGPNVLGVLTSIGAVNGYINRYERVAPEGFWLDIFPVTVDEDGVMMERLYELTEDY